MQGAVDQRQRRDQIFRAGFGGDPVHDPLNSGDEGALAAALFGAAEGVNGGPAQAFEALEHGKQRQNPPPGEGDLARLARVGVRAGDQRW